MQSLFYVSRSISHILPSSLVQTSWALSCRQPFNVYSNSSKARAWMLGLFGETIEALKQHAPFADFQKIKKWRRWTLNNIVFYYYYFCILPGSVISSYAVLYILYTPRVKPSIAVTDELVKSNFADRLSSLKLLINIIARAVIHEGFAGVLKNKNILNACLKIISYYFFWRVYLSTPISAAAVHSVQLAANLVFC